MSTEQVVSLVQLPQATVTAVWLTLRPGSTREEWRAVLAALRSAHVQCHRSDRR